MSLLLPAAAALLLVTAEPSPTPLATGTESRSSWLVPVAHTAGVMVGMRLSLSLAWPRAYDPTGPQVLNQYGRSWTEPPDFRPGRLLFESDGDPWQMNVIGHGLFGSEVYQRARHCGQRPLPAFLASALASAVWEYVPEAFHKQPSALDLVWTPVSGALLGEGRYQVHRLLSGEGSDRWWKRTLRVIVDPLGGAERRWLGTRC